MKPTIPAPPLTWRTRSHRPLDFAAIVRTEHALRHHYGAEYLFVGENIERSFAGQTIVSTFERNDWGIH